jgi:hypothetical protein
MRQPAHDHATQASVKKYLQVAKAVTRCLKPMRKNFGRRDVTSPGLADLTAGVAGTNADSAYFLGRFPLQLDTLDTESGF